MVNRGNSNLVPLRLDTNENWRLIGETESQKTMTQVTQQANINKSIDYLHNKKTTTTNQQEEDKQCLNQLPSQLTNTSSTSVVS